MGIGFRDLFELPLRFLVPKIVQQGDAADKGGLNCGHARNRERHGTQALGGGSVRRGQRQERKQQ